MKIILILFIQSDLRDLRPAFQNINQVKITKCNHQKTENCFQIDAVPIRARNHFENTPENNHFHRENLE